MTFCEVAAPARSNPKWTPELIKTLSELHEQGYSATAKQRKINELYGTSFSRNSIIGASHRANLPKRPSTKLMGTHSVRRERISRRDTAPRSDRKRWQHFGPAIHSGRAEPRPDVPSIVDLEIPQEQRRTLLELTEHTCRWPVGDVGEPGFFFCGAEPMAEHPYCAAHHQRGTYVRVR